MLSKEGVFCMQTARTHTALLQWMELLHSLSHSEKNNLLQNISTSPAAWLRRISPLILLPTHFGVPFHLKVVAVPSLPFQ